MISAIQWVFEKSKSKGLSRLVLLALANYSNNKGVAWPSLKTLQVDTNASRRGVINAVQNLVDIGEILVDENEGRNGTNKYLLVKYVHPSSELSAPPSEDTSLAASEYSAPPSELSAPLASELSARGGEVSSLGSEVSSLDGSELSAPEPLIRTVNEPLIFKKTPVQKIEEKIQSLTPSWRTPLNHVESHALLDNLQSFELITEMEWASIKAFVNSDDHYRPRVRERFIEQGPGSWLARCLDFAKGQSHHCPSKWPPQNWPELWEKQFNEAPEPRYIDNESSQRMSFEDTHRK